jgi:hypothetical protein
MGRGHSAPDQCGEPRMTAVIRALSDGGSALVALVKVVGASSTGILGRFNLPARVGQLFGVSL